MRKHLLFVWLLLCVAAQAMAQQRSIQGIVRSTEKDEPLPGVTVVVKGTTNGASTGPDGGFTITLPANATDVVLRLSYIGFISKDVPVGSSNNVTVALSPDTKLMEDVVVIGYQAVNRRDVTGSVSSVNSQQIKDIPVNSAAEALSGRLAGVQLTASEGAPGADFQIRVRGGGSITQDNSPLYVVDGVQLENALSVLSPQDIQTVDVLKDAAATAIYGARGANGVVIITTKGGREGKTAVTYNGFAGFRRISQKLDVLQPADYVDYAYEKATISGGSALASFKSRFGSTTFRDQRDYSQVQGYDTLGASRNAEFIDWQDRVFGRDAFQQTHNLSVSGGAKGTTYSLSLTRNDEDGVQINSGFTRNLLNFRFDHKANDKFRFGFGARLTDQSGTGAGTSNQGSGSTTDTRLRNAIVYQPITIPGQNIIEEVQDEEFYLASGRLTNPVITSDNEFRRDLRRVFNLNGTARYNILKNLSVSSTVGFDNTNNRVESFNAQFSPSVRNFANLPFITINTGQSVTINNSNVLAYSLKKAKHSFDGLLGQEIYYRKNTFLNTTSYYLPLTVTAQRAIDNIAQRDPSAPSTPQPAPVTGLGENSRLLSGFGRLNYAYDDKYLLTLTFRADGSSKFKEGNRIGYFPAASAAWRISQESFMKPYENIISDMKLRASYGLSGNNRIRDFLYDPLFGIRTGSENGNVVNTYYDLNGVLTPGISAISLANPNLIWETTVAGNLGLDVSLFNNRVQFTGDVYLNKTRDLLLDLAIPATTGYATQQINRGSTSNRGVELQLSGTVLQTPDFTWTANANTSFNRGRVESLGGISQLDPQYSGWASTAITADYLVRVGEPVGQMYGYVTDFDNGSKGFYTAADFSGYTTANGGQWILNPGVVSDRGVTGFSGVGQQVTPGTIKLKDMNGDGEVTAADRVVIGNANPKFTGGFNQQFTYKGFDASVFLNFVYGNDVYNANKIELTSYTANTQLSNGLAIMKDRYRQIDENGAIITNLEKTRELNQNASIWSPQRVLFPHSWAIEDGSFLRINNVTLGYSLPKAIIQTARLTQARFYLTVNNLYTFTKYSGFDPEVNSRRNPLTPGVDYAAYPRSKAFLMGVNLTF